MNAALAAMHQDLVEPAPDLLADTLAGLSRTPKQLLSKYFYDARGSQLFEQITHQPEYYLTRVERALLDARLDDIGALIGAGALLLMATIVLLLEAAVAGLVAYGLSWPVAILIIAALTLLGGTGLVWVGFNRLSMARLAPSKTLDQLQKDSTIANMR